MHFLGFEKSAEFVRKRLAEAGETFSDSEIFEPFHSALLDLFRRSAWRELGCLQNFSSDFDKFSSQQVHNFCANFRFLLVFIRLYAEFWLQK